MKRTIFTLLAVPVFYTLIDGATEGLRNGLRSLLGRTREPAADAREA